MAAASYINPRSGASWPADRALWRAPDDGGLLELAPGRGLARDEIERPEPSLWRYRAAIRVEDRGRVSLGEGFTPLVETQWAGRRLLFKCEHLMPTGSFKDRGAAVMVSHLKQAGVEALLEDSSGNAGASIAAYAAAAGIHARIMAPAGAPAAKRIQIAAAGAELLEVAGDRGAVEQAALAAAEELFYASHNRQPFFLEGVKTLAFELWEQLGFRAPAAVAAPCGNGANILGLYLGFRELQEAGEIEALPRLHAVQAANNAPIRTLFDGRPPAARADRGRRHRGGAAGQGADGGGRRPRHGRLRARCGGRRHPRRPGPARPVRLVPGADLRDRRRSPAADPRRRTGPRPDRLRPQDPRHPRRPAEAALSRRLG